MVNLLPLCRQVLRLYKERPLAQMPVYFCLFSIIQISHYKHFLFKVTRSGIKDVAAELDC